MTTPRRIQFLIFPGLQALDAAGPHQMFAGANQERPGSYTLSIAAAAAGPVACESGLTLTADRAFSSLSARALARVDTLIVVGGDVDGMRAALADGRITAIAQRAVGRTRRIASVCTGAFFLAAGGLLDGKRAATHWRAIAALRRFRPQVDVDADSIFVRADNLWTSAGVTAGIDLALALIEADLGRDVALAVARRHVVYRVRPGGQAQFSAALAAQAAPDADKALARATRAVIAAPEKDWRVERLAEAAGTSVRSLTRGFARALNTSPAAFVARARLDAARRMLVETTAPIDQVALRCGFASLRRLDRAFQRTLSISPSAFRARFATSQSKDKTP
ncbi:MAG: helix-turn-helix domain-containing protein [Alphaproteobacteria bacterium]|nr:helix-turn-helix domain-containing protein [Alphaproteobacteria bacterium]